MLLDVCGDSGALRCDRVDHVEQRVGRLKHSNTVLGEVPVVPMDLIEAEPDDG